MPYLYHLPYASASNLDAAVALVSTFWCVESFAIELLNMSHYVANLNYVSLDFYIGYVYGATWTVGHVLFYALRESIRKPWRAVFNSQVSYCSRRGPI